MAFQTKHYLVHKKRLAPSGPTHTQRCRSLSVCIGGLAIEYISRYSIVV